MTQLFWTESNSDCYRDMSDAAHKLLKHAVSAVCDIPADEVIILKDEKGKPFIADRDDVFVSISHSKGMVLCAVSDYEIGVDVELCSKRRKSVESRVFNDCEISLIDASNDKDKAFFRLWTLKESYLKAIGTGFSDNAKDIEFLSLENPVSSSDKTFYFSVGERNGFVFAVCEKRNIALL